jgi:IS30 family transposase
VNDHLSTRELGWIIGESASTIRRLIRDGDIEASRVVGGFRVSREEALRVARETIEKRAGRKLSDRELEKLIDDVIATNEARLADAAAVPLKPTSPRPRRRG